MSYNPLFSQYSQILNPQPTPPQNLNFDWLNRQNQSSPNYQSLFDGNLSKVADATAQNETPTVPQVAAKEAGALENKLQQSQAIPANTEQTQQPAQTQVTSSNTPQAQTATDSSTTPATNVQSQNTLADTIKQYNSAKDALSNKPQSFSLQNAMTSDLNILPDRNQYNNNSLLKLQNIEPENWTPQEWG